MADSMAELKEFREGFLEDRKNDALSSGLTVSDAFLQYCVGLVGPDGVGDIEDPQDLRWDAKVRNGRRSKIDGYGLNQEVDNSICLFVSLFSGEIDPGPVTQTEIYESLNRMRYFLDEVHDGTLHRYCDDSDPCLEIGQVMKTRMSDPGNPIRFIKLFVFTDRKLSLRVKKFDQESFHDIPVSAYVYDIERLKACEENSMQREPIEVDFAQFGIKGIQAIDAGVQSPDYKCYLAVIPGILLAKLFNEYQSRLLEGNVRAFLSGSKINKGIKTTIAERPTYFLAYNNGIAITATDVRTEAVQGSTMITYMKDFQIINGGQTTVSLANALAAKQELDTILVAAKITIINPNNVSIADMVANISRYANTQNKVNDSDLTSNNPFNVAMEIASKKYMTPIRAGETLQTCWYYERARGLYNQLTFGQSRRSAKWKTVRARYPSEQKLTKEQVAKYWMAAIQRQPHVVSLGSQKCLKVFAQSMDTNSSKWTTDVNEWFFHKVVCSAILFRRLDHHVEAMKKEDGWYESGGFKSNIVPYAISRFMQELVNSGYEPDYKRIWRDQDIPSSWMSALDEIARKTNNWFKSHPGVIVTEWAKKEETWKTSLKEISFELDIKSLDGIVTPSENSDIAAQARRDKKADIEADLAMEIFNKGTDWWTRFIAEAQRLGKVGPNELSLLNLARDSTLGKKYPTAAQQKLIWKLKNILEDCGVIV